MCELDLSLEERVIFALIFHFTEVGDGYFAGYKAMSDKLRIPKSKCKAAVQKLKSIGAITESHETINNAPKIALRINLDFIQPILWK